jgi:hypothetical protein
MIECVDRRRRAQVEHCEPRIALLFWSPNADDLSKVSARNAAIDTANTVHVKFA